MLDETLASQGFARGCPDEFMELRVGPFFPAVRGRFDADHAGAVWVGLGGDVHTSACRSFNDSEKCLGVFLVAAVGVNDLHWSTSYCRVGNCFIGFQPILIFIQISDMNMNWGSAKLRGRAKHLKNLVRSCARGMGHEDADAQCAAMKPKFYALPDLRDFRCRQSPVSRLSRGIFFGFSPSHYGHAKIFMSNGRAEVDDRLAFPLGIELVDVRNSLFHFQCRSHAVKSFDAVSF